MAQKPRKQPKTDIFTSICKSDLKIEVVKEYKFHPVRKWRFDFAIPEHKIAIEIDGGVWNYGRHNRAQLVEMIKGDLHRGHNLYSDFDPYPGWGSHQLCGYEIEMKEIKIIESPEVDDDVLCIAFYQEGFEDIILPLVCDFSPIEVLFNIYASMK